MPLRTPPGNLRGFPPRRDSAALRSLFRVTRRRPTPAPPSPWWFSQLPAGAGRFDLPTPEGTCYWSSPARGAVLETFRDTRLIAAPDVAARWLWQAAPPKLRLANLLAPRAAAFGVTAAVSSQPDYTLPRQWGAALRRAGFDGLVGSCSHDPASKALNVAIFGPGGRQPRRAGWTVRHGAIETHPGLLRQLAAFGVRIDTVPYTLPTVAPPL